MGVRETDFREAFGLARAQTMADVPRVALTIYRKGDDGELKFAEEIALEAPREIREAAYQAAMERIARETGYEPCAIVREGNRDPRIALGVVKEDEDPYRHFAEVDAPWKGGERDGRYFTAKELMCGAADGADFNVEVERLTGEE